MNKKSVGFSLLLIAGISISICAQEIKNAGDYMSFVGTQFEEISKDMMSYTSAAAHGKSARKVDKRRKELLLTVKTAETNMRKLKPFNGDRAYRDSVASYFRITGIVLNEEYGKIVDMEEVAEQSYDLMEAYLLAQEKAEDKLDEAHKKASAQQRAFAEKNKIKLIENDSKLSEKLEKAGKVSQYYHKIYLLFFKSYKDDIYFTDAQNKSDAAALDQTKSSLDKDATEGMRQLMKTASFENDGSLKNACMKALEFYKSESSKAQGLVDYLLKKENFEKTKKAFDAKRESDRTKEDVDSYNKGISEYNAAVNKFNSLNNELNKNRNTVLNNWNKAVDEFFDNHTPKYR